jgi:hypothetical protein
MTVSVRCYRCGAAVEASPQAHSVNCGHCGAGLLLRHEGGVWFSEPHRADAAAAIAEAPTPGLPEVLPAASGRSDRPADSRVDRLESEMDRLRLENELLRLDADWDREREQHMVRTRYGRLVEPNPVAGLVFIIIGASVAGVGLLVGVGLALATRQPGMLCCTFTAFLPGGAMVGAGFLQRYKGLRYQEARKAYQRERDDLLDRLDELDRRERDRR